MGQWPNMLCGAGAALVMGSVVGMAVEEKNSNQVRRNPYEGLS